jgi:hypothetical protein
MPSRFPVRRTASIAALFHAVAALAAATSYQWNTTTGTFDQTANWSRTDGQNIAGFPHVGDTANFNQPYPFTVTFSSSAAADVFNFVSGDVTFASVTGQKNFVLNTGLAQANLTDGTLTLGLPSAAVTLNATNLTLSTGNQLNVTSGSDLITANLNLGAVASPSATSLTVDGVSSTLTVNGPSIIGGNLATGSVTLSNQSAATFTGAITLGDDTGVGSLSILSNSTVTAASMNLAILPASTGSASLVVSSSSLTLTGASTFTLGSSSGPATTASIDSSTFTTGTGLTTINPTGSLNVTGNSTFNLNGSLLVSSGSASFSPNSLIWTPGKSITATAAGAISLSVSAPFTIPANSPLHLLGGSFTLTPTDPNLDTTLLFAAGSSADISSAGSLTASSLQLGATGASALTVDGAGSSLSIAGSPYPTTIASTTGTGALTIRNDAVASFDSTLSVASTGTSATGIITVQSGGTLFLNNLDLASTSTGSSHATLSLSGAGSSVLLAGSLTAGNPASLATINVSTGATLVQGDTSMSPIGVPIGTGFAQLQRGATLTIAGGFVSLGTLSADPSTISLLSGSLGFVGPLVIGDAGPLGYSLTLTPQMSLALTGPTSINVGGSLSLAGGSLSTDSLINNGSLSFSSGTLALTGPTGLSISSTGPLGSSPNLSIGKNLLISSSTNLPSTSSLSITGGSLTTDSLTNAGSITVNNYGLLAVSSSLTNSSTGRLFLGPDLTSSFDGPATNAGRITLQGGSTRIVGDNILTNTGLITGDGEVAKPLANSSTGELRAQLNQTLLISGPSLTNTGKINLTGGSIEFSDTLINNNSILGRGTLTANAGLTNNASMSFSAGIADVYGPVTNNSQILVTGSSTTTFYDPLTNSTGADIFTAANSSVVFLAPVSGAGTFSGSGTKYFSDGSSTTAPLETTGFTVVDEPASLTTPDFQEQSVTINGSLTTTSPNHPSQTQSLLVGPTGSLNLTTSSLIIDPNAASPFTTQYTPSSASLQLRQYLHTHQLYSSTANSDPTHLLAIGYIDNSLLGVSTWSNLPVSPTATLTKLTDYGDANLDGKVNADDYALIDRAYAQHLTSATWSQGDFNYDGVINQNDYLLIDRTYLLQTQGFSPGFLAQRESQFGPAYVTELLISLPDPSLSSILYPLSSILLLPRRRKTKLPST